MIVPSHQVLGALASIRSYGVAMTETIEKRAKRLGYPAELRNPMIRPHPLGFLGEDLFNAEDLLNAALSERVRLLMKHYRIEASDPHCFARLAFYLAQDWVPGCQIVDKAPRRRGAPRKVTPLDLVQLYIDIYQIHQERPEESIHWACATYRQRNKAHPLWGERNPRTLVNRYGQGKRHFELYVT